jgi:tripartite-type tricarboxylate transporter receptor subunit TctC
VGTGTFFRWLIPANDSARPTRRIRTLEGRKSLRLLLAANKRLNTTCPAEGDGNMPKIESIPRRTALKAAALLTVSLSPCYAGAQEWAPDHAIKFTVAMAAGGGADPLARMLGKKLSDRLGQPVYIENKGGAGGVIGADYVAKSPPDGTNLLFTSATLVTNAASGKSLPYKLSDLQPIGMVGTGPMLVIVPADSSFSTLKELLNAARARPMSISYGSSGVGSFAHLSMELLASEAKVKLVHIPYRGNGAAIPDLLGGRLQVMIVSTPVGRELAASGRIRILATTSLQALPSMPRVPTASEAGVPGLSIAVWWGLLGPAGLAPHAVKRLNEELNWALAQPDVRLLLEREGATPKSSTPQEFGAFISSEAARWSRLVNDADIKM